MIEFDTINLDKMDDIQLVKHFQTILIGCATGVFIDDEIYSLTRTKILSNKSIAQLLPDWVSTHRTKDQFWAFIKVKYSSYKERREYIWSEFAKIFEFLEKTTNSPLEEIISFDEPHIHLQWEKALKRKQSDPEGAITLARTLIESTLKHILDEKSITYEETADLPELYKKVASTLRLSPESHQEQIFKQILGGANSVIFGLGTLRNKLGDAHGKSKRNVKPSERHSELAVNLAGAMAIFLFKTFEESKKK